MSEKPNLNEANFAAFMQSMKTQSTSPTEPSHVLRQGAKEIFQVYTAYKGAGFTADEAMQIVVAQMTAHLNRPKE